MNIIFGEYDITTIYIGGGTPSYIEGKYIKKLLEKLKQRLRNNETKWENIEITIEVNPGTVTKQKLKQYKEAGINRVSIGLQSRKDELLKQIGRIHNYQEFLEAYARIQEAGFENINVDLMIGLPNQTIQDIKQTLEEIKRLKPNHVSVYSLIVEEDTKIERLIREGKLKLPDEEIERRNVLVCKKHLGIRRI